MLKSIQPAIVMGEVETAVESTYLAFPLVAAAAGITFAMALVFTCLLTLMTTFITWLFLVIYTLFTFIAGFISFSIYMD
jgi:hypothetical protein